MSPHRAANTKWIAVLAFSIWLAITGTLCNSLVEPLTFAVQMVCCFLVGYAVVSLWHYKLGAIEIVLATILGVEILTSVYALTRFLGSTQLHWVFFLTGAGLGAYRLVRLFRGSVVSQRTAADAMLETAALWAGIVAMITIGSAFYFSGRNYYDGLTFFGPMGRDHAFNLALMGRLEYNVPPDNFVVSGYPFPSYHFFCNLTPLLFAKDMGKEHLPLDVYYRLYPGVIFFLIGFLSFWVPARAFASRKAGVIGAVLIVFGADFSWVLGLLQTIKAVPNFTLVQEKLFGSWFAWSGFGTLYPLVHRPAYYHGLVLLLAGLAPIVGRGGKSYGAWVIAGLIWGLMAGYNYPLAVIIGMSIVLSSGFFLFRGDRENARHLALCALVLALASLIANFFFLSLGNLLGHGNTPLFSWAPLEFARQRFGWMFGGEGSGLLPLAGSVLAFALLSYGLKLVGIWPMLRGSLRFRSNSAVGAIVLGSFVISIIFGLFLQNKGVVSLSNNIMYLQPTGWMIGLFATFLLTRWMSRKRSVFRLMVITFLLIVGPLQAIPQFNLGYKIVFEPEYSFALQRIRAEADEKDVIAFWPDRIMGRSILGSADATNNFFVSALTGLRAYFSVKPYSEYFAGGETGWAVYEDRAKLLRGLMEDKPDQNIFDKLMSDNVKWVILPKHVDVENRTDVNVWISTPEFTVLRLGYPRN